MAETYDIIVAGAGHWGLGAACYFVKAGYKTLVLEATDKVGGGVISREFAPGFIGDPCCTIHAAAQGSPIIKNDELGLIKDYGLEYLYPEVEMCIHFTDGETFSICKSLERTVEQCAKFSKHDADAYRKFVMMAQAGVPILGKGRHIPAPSYGQYASMMDRSEEGRELLRNGMISCLDIMNDWFEDPHIRIALTRWISECMISPKTKGTGTVMYTLLGTSHMEPGAGLPVGGSGRLSECMEQYIIDNGGEIRLNSEVVRIITDNGVAKGVELANGEQIMATKMVLASINLKRLFPGMVDDPAVTETFQRNVDRLRPSFSAFNQNLALEKAPEWVSDDPNLDEAFLVEFAPSNEEEYMRYFDDLEYGVPHHFPLLSIPTVHDPSRAPEGKHVAYFYEYAPYNLKDGGAKHWDEIRGEYAQGMIDFLKPYVRNLDDDNIIAQYIQSPLDLERMYPNFIEGDFGEFEATMDQFLGNRPLPGYGFKTPIKNLMIAGPQCHPGSGSNCGGRVAAMAVFQELGTSIEKVMAE